MSLCAYNDFNNAFEMSGAGRMLSLAHFDDRVNETPPPDKDVELLQRIAQRDSNAFAEFYDRHSTLLYSVACKILNEPGEAQDVLQEVCVQIWEKAANFDPKLGKASTWVAVLVRNKAIDRIRASQRRSRLNDEAGAQMAIATESDATINESVYGHDKAKMIQTAIVELPQEQRQAIELAFFSGLTQNEISEKLQQPLGTIKARIRRGMQKLRDQLEGLL